MPSTRSMASAPFSASAVATAGSVTCLGASLKTFFPKRTTALRAPLRPVLSFFRFPSACARSAASTFATAVPRSFPSVVRAFRSIASPPSIAWRSASRQVMLAKPVASVIWHPVMLQTASVHASASSHSGTSAASSSVCEHPASASHVSAVHATPSSQPPDTGVQMPASQENPPQRPSGSQSRASAQGMQLPVLSVEQTSPMRHVSARHVLPGWPFCSPSSHSSPQSTVALPQSSSTPPACHPSHGSVLLPSHSSRHSCVPLPPASISQKRLQPSQSSVLPSSHCSPSSGSSWSSPQSGGGRRVQFAAQREPGCPFCAPRSHSSAHSCVPLPHCSTVQRAEQASSGLQDTAEPGSHVSEHSTTSSPQTSSAREQSPRQPSQSSRLPSSHSSHGASSRSLPQATILHAFEQASHGSKLPSSHSSPSSASPSWSHAPGPPHGTTASSVAMVGAGMTEPVTAGAVASGG